MKKELVKNQSAFNVTFDYNVVPENPVLSVLVLGDFNEWSVENGYALKKNKHGNFEGTFKIPAGRDYHFRYLVNGERWANERDADRFASSPLHPHIDNSVLSLPHVEVAKPVSKSASSVKPATDGASGKTAATKSAPSKKTAPAKASPKKEAAKAAPAKAATTAAPKKEAPKAVKSADTSAKAAAAPKASTAKAAAKASPAKPAPAKKDDLTKIEGIGPKIAELLTKGGIDSFASLANAKKAALTQILDAAGTKFAMHDPTSWPQQAKLADSGKWDQLAKLQGELKGGKK